MISSFRPSVAQTERLEMLIEECAEVIHAATKILRHGYNSYHPDTQEVNRDALRRELTDLEAVYQMMTSAGDVPEGSAADVFDAVSRKKRYTYAQ